MMSLVHRESFRAKEVMRGARACDERESEREGESEEEGKKKKIGETGRQGKTGGEVSKYDVGHNHPLQLYTK